MARPIGQFVPQLHPGRWHQGRSGRKIEIVVLHSTDIVGAHNVPIPIQNQYRTYLNALSRPGTTAPHFVVDTDGTTVQCVGLTHTAHHAGISQWAPGGTGNMLRGRACQSWVVAPPPPRLAPFVNCISIGIEMAHIDHQGVWPEPQVRQVGYILALLDRYRRRVPPAAAQIEALSWDSIDGRVGTVVSHRDVVRQAGPLRPPAQGRNDPVDFDWRLLDRLHAEEWEQVRVADPAALAQIVD